MNRLFYLFLCCLCAYTAAAQSPYLSYNQDYYHLVDRLEIRQGHWASGFHSTVKPYSRQSIMELVDSVSINMRYPLSKTDYFNLDYLRDDSWEVARPDTLPGSTTTSSSAFTRLKPISNPVGNSDHPLLGRFYQKKADFYSLQTDDFDLHVNPVFYYSYGKENVTSDRLFTNTRGLEVRGTIGKKLGFYTFFSDNQAVFPQYIRDYGAIYGRGDDGFAPGEGLTKRTTNGSVSGADFLSARGHITFNVLKIINVQFGHDRNFFGNGYRSLLLSDNSAPYLFLKLTTHFGKNIQYTNLFTEFQNTQNISGGNELLPQKFAAIHHLSVNISSKVNVGVFEAEVFSRDRFDINYLNPIVFYRYIESYRGSADNAFIGLDAKVTVANHLLAYGQLMLDEFLINSVRKNPGSWTNKFAGQIGIKYIDAFGVPNLDLQGEFNAARPYTYQHITSQTNYAHYSQPLAHPLGANFMEGLGIARYQLERLTAIGTFGVMLYGTDSPFRNYGGDVLKSYETRVRDDGNFIGQGRQTITTYADLRLSYMFRHNVFLDARYLYRFQDSQYKPNTYTTNLASIAIRWNLAYRGWVF